MTDAYRTQSPQHQEAWDWDVIVYPDGSIRVLCIASECVHKCSYSCDCASKPRISSPIVDEYERPLVETPYANVSTGDARHLLTTRSGSLISVMSGKTYRLHGPRVVHQDFASTSIWAIYRDPEPHPTWIQRVTGWLHA